MRKRKPHKKNQQAAARKAFVFEELEPRVLLSADLPLDLPDTNVPEEFSDQEILQDINAQQYASPAQDAGSRELIFVDTDTPEYQTLLSDLLKYPDETTSYQVFELDNTRDGIAQITEILGAYKDVSAVHILSHGTEAAFDLGGSTLDSNALAANAERVSTWGSAFTEDGDILIYGCNLAATSEGQMLVNSIATLTGADVAASDDLTGNAQLGGDWILEHATGEIETSVAISAQGQQSWGGVLGTPVANDDAEITNEDTAVVIDVLANDTDPDLDPMTTRVVTGPSNGTLVPNPVELINEVNLTNNAANNREATWSPDGTKIAFRSDLDGNNEIYVMDADGSNVVRLTNNAGSDGRPDWSPDGSQIIFSSDRDGNNEIYVMDADGSNQTRLTNNAGSDEAPVWSPDGTKIAFKSDRDGNQEIYVMDADGSNQTRITNNAATDSGAAWSPDGTQIAFVSDRDGNNEIYAMDADGSNQTRITNDAAIDSNPTWSPDGSKILFKNNSGGDYELYVMDADGSNQMQLTNNTANEGSPEWSPDGARIVFHSNRDGNFDIYVAEMLSSGTFTYTPNAGFSGIDSFTYVANDGASDSNVATVSITVGTFVNDAPTFIGNSIGYWNFDEGSGDSVAESAIGISTGTLGSTAGADANDPTWTTGKFGQALHFDGVNDYVEIADAPGLDISGPEFSASLWMNPDSGPNKEDMLFMKGDRQGNINYYLSWKDSGEMTWAFKDSAGWHYQDMAVTMPTTGQWNHIGITFDRPTVSLYVNGTKYVFDNVATGGSMDRDLTANDEVLWIGAGRSAGALVGVNQWSGPFTGSIDELALFNRALTDAEIEAIRTSTPPVVTASAFSIDEDSANNTVVGTVVANDQDIGDVLSYAISAGNTDGAFSIDANGQLKVANSTALDFETNPNFNLTIEATDDGSPSLSDTTTVTITLNNVNDAPTYTSTALAPTWSENGGAVSLFSGTSIDAIEAGDLINVLTINISGLADGSDEILMIDGQAIALTDLNSVTTVGNGYDVSVSVPGSIADVTISRVGGFSAAAAEALVDGLAYDNASAAPQGAARLVRLGLIQDDGGTANGGQNTTAYNLDSLVIFTTNSPPQINSDGGGETASINVVENTTAVTTVGATDADLDTLTYSLAPASDDDGFFTINSSTGELAFSSAPNYEVPADLNGDNVYEVTVQVSDGNGGVDAQAISVTVAEVLELVVSNTNATGTGSLHEAILNANANTGVTDTITFNIPGSGPHVISLTAALPTITDSVIIDATTDPDYAGDPIIRIDGSSAGAGVNGLTFTSTSDNSVVRGLMITGFTQHGIQINSGADSLTIANNWIGTSGTGSVGDGIGNTGINVQGANTVIGGTGANDGNVITNNGNEGINLTGAGATGTIIQGNIIGLDPDGATGSGNTDVGIALLSGSHNTTIGGTTAAERNIISNNFEGIEINSNNNIVQGNYIGTDITGTLDRGNRSDDGVEIQSGASGNLIGGTVAGAGNLIAYNARDGVYLASGSGNTVLGNVIHSNSDLGIDLGTTGVTVNDANDADGGSNNTQNFPVITQAAISGTDLTLSGTLDTDGLTTQYSIEFYGNAAGTTDATNGEGRVYLGSTTVTTDGSGDASFSNVVLNGVTLVAGDYVTATATRITDPGQVGVDDQLAYGASSEFAANVVIMPANTAPVINSDGGGATANINVAENTMAVTTVTATDADLDALTYTISGGADAALFSIDASTGALTFKGAPDFETPTDAGANNVYDVTVQVDDGNGGTDTQAISVTVTNIDPTAVNDNYAVDADSTLSVDWWDINWSHRQQLTFDNLAQSETLTDFPVLIVLNAGNIGYAQTNDDGSDLRFFAADGTELVYEIEQWNEGGDSSVWVRVPQITGNSNTDSIWMYYGNAAATSGESAAGVWDSNFVGVWHLNEEQAGTGGTDVYKDSTSYGNDGTDRVAVTGQEGQVTNGQQFGANDWVEIDHDANLDLRDSMTISFWIKPTSDSGTFNRVVEKGLWGYNNSYYFGGGNGLNDLTFYLNGQEVFDTPDDVLTVGVWQHAAVSYTSNGVGTGTATLYLNGVETASGNYTNGAVVGNTGRLAFGHDDPGYDFDGFIDEVQISNTDRSADWIAAQYQATRNQFGAEFVQFDVEESAPAAGGVMSNDMPDGTPEINVTNLNTAGTLGLVTLNSDGTFSYDPNGQFDYLAAGVTATDTFTYDVTEANGATNTATVTITITGVNDAPVLNITGTPGLTQIDEGDINNAGDSVASIIASAGGDPISDVDASPAEGIAITWADNSIGSWEYSTDGGSTWLAIGTVSDTSALLLTDAANNRVRFVPAENFNGIAQFSYRAWDRTDGNANETPGVDVSGNGSATAYSTTTETASVSVRPLHVIMYLATSGDVSVSNAPGLDSWSAGEAIALGDPNIKFEPGTTDGTLYRFLDLRDFNTGAIDPMIDGIHQVSKDTSIGGNGGPGMDLFVGDILFSVNSNSVRLTGSDLTEITTNKKSLYLFRPDTPGDYSAGTFSLVLDNFSTNEVEGISLVEVDTMVGDTLLQSGTFLFNPGNSRDIFLYTADGVGAGTTTGVTSTLISGDHINMNSASAKVSGLDLIEKDVNLGDTSLSVGNILVTLDGNDAGVGNNNLSVTSNDVFYLDISTTTLGVTNTTTANAYLLIEGADLNFDIANEEITALSLEIKYGSGNEDPDISFPGTSITYTENDPAVLIDTGATVNDPDSFDFAGGILSVDFSTGGTADDRLSIRNEGSDPGQVGATGTTVAYGGLTVATITGGMGTSPLVINFNSNADATAVQAVLRNISYENVSDNPGTTARNVRVVLSDGDGGTSNVENKTINMVAINDAPALATNTGITVAEGSTGSVITAVMLNEGDPDDSGSGVTYTITAVPANGTLYLSGTALGDNDSFTQADIDAGFVTYDHDGTQNFSDSFTFSIADGGEDGATTLTGQVFSITVTNVNDAPVGVPTITGAVQEDQELTVDTSGISDTDGLGTFSYQWLRDGATIGGATGSTYTLGDADVGARISVQVSYTDAYGAPEGPLTSAQTPPVTGVNDTPVANADTATTAEDVVLNNIDVLGNDTDVDGDTLSVTGASALNGSVSVNPDGTLNYTPNLNFNGSDTISYDISDGNGGIDTGSLTITVTAVNDNPVAVADTATTAEDVVLSNIDVLGNDTDVDGDTLSVTGATAANGTVTVNGDGTLNYTPNLNFNGTDTISYDLSDGNGGIDTGTLTITVTAVNDNPVANADTASTNEDVVLNNIDVLGNDTDVEGDTLTVTGATAANGTVTVNGDGTLNYTPNLNFNGSDTISYDISDGNGGIDTGTLTITVTAVNDNPVAVADTATTAEDVVLNNIDVLGNDTDVEGNTLTVTGATAANGTVTVNGDGTLNYTPNLNFNGTDIISYDISDGNGGIDTGTLTITVTAVNDNPVAVADMATTAEDVVLNNIDVLGNDTDVDGDTLSVTGAIAANGTVTVNGDGTLNYTPNLNFNGTDTISYDIVDGNGGTDTGTLTITVTAVNDNPVAVADTATTAEDVVLNNIDVLGNDTDVDGDTLSVTGASALNGSVSVNPDGTLNYTPNLNFNGTDTISYDISDGNGGTDTGTLTMTVTAVNDNPVANADTASTAEDVALNNINVLGNDTDVDGDTLSVTGATAVNGTVTVNGDGTLNYTPNLNFNGTDTISYDIADGNGGTATGTLTITVTGVNNNPVANADAATTAEDVALNNINVLGNDTDVDGDTLSVTGASATNGTVTVNGDGTLNYTPNLNFNGSDTISYDIADGNGGMASGTLTITVTAVNDNPVANADTATTSEDIVLNNIDVLGNDTDVDGDILSVTGASALNGSVTINPDGTLNYTPNADFNGTDTISYDLSDGNGGTDTGTLTITVTAVNDNPVANADTATTSEDVVLSNIDVLGNDTDVDGNTLTVTGATAANGTVTVNGDGTLNYTPNLNFNGSDTISYDLSDGNGGNDTGTLTITVTAVNDNPVANTDSATTSEDININNINVLANDSDIDGDVLAVTGATAANGTVTVNPDGTLNYTPNADFNGTDTISYDIADGNGGTDTGTLTITVTAVNDNPVANADTATTNEDVALNNIDVLGNDTDVEGDTLSVTGASALNGTVTVNGDGTLNYTPNLNYNGTDTISYDISDGNGGVATGTLTITVTAVNDNPVANADTATTSEDVALNNIDVLGNDTDVEGDTLSVTGATAANGTVTVNGDGTLNYTPNLNFNGTDTISYDIADGNGGTATGTLTITVTGVNNNPVANADTATTAEDVALNNINVLGNDTDVDGDTMSVTGASALNGTVTVNGDSTLNYTPNLNFNGSDTISYDISDGNGGSDTGTLTITVTAVNDNPVANADTATTAEDVVLNNIDVLGNDTDVDGDTLSVTGASALNGTVTVNGDGTLNYTPNLNFNGSDTITYDLSDGNGGTDTGTLTITVTVVNDNPVANSDTATTSEDVVLNNIDVLGTDTDVDGDTLSVTGASAANGTVTVNPDGTLNYTPNADFNGTDTISYDLSDGNGGTDTGTLTITVTAVNDNPVANTDSATTSEDININNINVLANDTDVDSNVLAVTGATAVNGTVTVNPDGTLNYTPNADFNGTDTISYDLSDGNGGTDSGTLTITVTAVNDNPVANADTVTTSEDIALNNIEVLGNDTDVDGGTLSVSGASALNGTVTVNPDGTLNYTPNLNFNGTDTISYDIADGNGGTATGTLTVTVTAVNDNPVASADTATTDEDVSLNNINVLLNDSDVDGNALTLTVASALNGSVTVNSDGTLNYTPNLNFNGTDTISYDISDGNGGTATGTLTITVTAVNDNPVANADTATTAEDVALNNIDVLANDTDVDGDTLSVTGATAANGTVAVNPDGTLNYTPNLGFNGTDTISYDISDGNGGTATGTLTITVTTVNYNPVANADTATTAEDVTLNNIDVLANDTDVDGDTLSVTGASALKGSVTVNPDGTLNYTPNANFHGVDTINYDITDGYGGTSNTGRVDLTVTAVNDAPANSTPGEQTTSIDTPLVFSSLDGNSISVTDPDDTGATLRVTLTASNGTLNLSGTNGLVFNAGDGIDDATMTFTGTAAAINAALDGLLFQPDTDYQGFTTVQLITDDLGNSGAGGVLNTLDSISISVVENAPVSDNLPPLDELIVDYPDLPEVDPDPVPPFPTVSTPAPVQEASGTASVGNVDTNSSDSRVTSGEVSVHESIVSAGGHVDQERADDRSISTRIWNAITDPLVSVRAIATLPPGALIWDFIDLMTDQINKNNSGSTDTTAYMIGTTTTGVTFAFSAGYVSWLLRAGYLSAALLSSAPVWRQFDPLPILGKPEEQERTADKDGQDSEQTDDKKVDDIFEPGARNGANEAVS